MKRKILLAAVLLPLFLAGQQPIIIDHTCSDLDEIPNEWIDSAKANLWIGYGHTSHGSQLATGMDALDSYFTDGTYAWSHTGGPGELQLFEGAGNSSGYLRADLGASIWESDTRLYLDDHPGCNVIIWSWCGQVDDVDLPSHYFGPMEQLEIDYPDVQFVYMTGHLEGEGPGGNLELANQQIRDFCTANNKILYDFADIEKFSPDADTNFQVYFGNDECNYNHPNGHTANWADYWLAENPGHELTQISQLCGTCSHSVTLNCTKKGIAAWYLWARLAGWDGGSTLPTSSFTLRDTACIYEDIDITYTGNASASATYNWDFDGATIISGSGQGPYTLQWPSIGDKSVSLYVEESGFTSDTSTNNTYISTGPTPEVQLTNLSSGWNIASFYITPSSLDMIDVFQPLIDDGKLVKITDEAGGFVQYITGPGWMNTIGNMSSAGGYCVNLSSGGSMSTNGLAVTYPFDISLSAGWNIMGYPCDVSQDAMTLLQPLIANNYLVKVLNESGGIIQYITGIGWINTINTFNAGEGYHINVNTNTTLSISDPGKGVETVYQSEVLCTQYFTSVTSNPFYPMNIVVRDIHTEGFEIEDGDEIAVYDGDLQVGSVVISLQEKDFQSIIARKDDPVTEITDGFTIGNGFTFKLWDKSEDVVYTNIEFTHLYGDMEFNPLATSVGDLKVSSLGEGEVSFPAGTFLGQNFPNPYSDKTRINYGITEYALVTISIHDVSGRTVMVLHDSHMSAGKYHLEMNRASLEAGVYYYRMTVIGRNKNFRETRRMILL